MADCSPADQPVPLLCVCRFLGHLYAAEALISLDRISDAIAHLNPENVSDVSMGVLSSEQDQGQSFSTLLWRPGCVVDR